MDPATAAAIAALIVSIFAFTIAFAQAIQQYFITGQLIRMCDSVVYGKMPGRGRRIWEFSQFRFRVVYSVPEFSLRPSLWSDGFPQCSSYTKGHLPVPDLRHSYRSNGKDFRHALSGWPDQQKQSEYTAIPGEASWVSFCRVIQYSSGNDLFFEMVNGDADRCPSDLPVVPMQVSMRDIVTFALMAGMTCTDASFEKKSLAMKGIAGAITTSWHPLLGAVLRFAPRNSSQPHGLRIGDGSVSPQWMARMWDVVVVAGRQYNLRERKSYAMDEGHWVTLSRDRTVAILSPTQPFLRSASLKKDIRGRRNSAASIRLFSRRANTAVSDKSYASRGDVEEKKAADNPDALIPRSPHDGAWSFETMDFASPSPQTVRALPPLGPLTPTPTPGTRSSRVLYQRWLEQLHKIFGIRKSQASTLAMSSYIIDMEITAPSKTANLPPLGPSTASNNQGETAVKGRDNELPLVSTRTEHFIRKYWSKPLDGSSLNKYIEEKRQSQSMSPIRGRLLLTWPTNNEEVTNGKVGLTDDWWGSYLELEQERTLSHIERWRGIVDRRQMRRDERDLQEEWEVASQRSSRPSGVGSRGASSRNFSTGSRSLSRESRKSGESVRAVHNHPLQSWERNLGRSPQTLGPTPGVERRESWDSVDLGSSVRRGRQDSSNKAGDERLVAYGEAPVIISQAAATQGNFEGERHQERSPPRNKAAVGFQLDEAADSSSPSSPNDHDDLGRRGAVRNSAVDRIPLVRNSDTEEDPSSTNSETFTHKRRSPTIQPTDNSKDESNESEIEGVVPGQRRIIEAVDPEETAAKPAKGILKQPREKFPEEAIVLREGIAPPKGVVGSWAIPTGARWTKIDRRLVNPEALEQASERFEERPNHVIVLRVLAKDEVQALAEQTQKIRDKRHEEKLEDDRRRLRQKSEDDLGRNYSPSHVGVSTIPKSTGAKHRSSPPSHPEPSLNPMHRQTTANFSREFENQHQPLPESSEINDDLRIPTKSNWPNDSVLGSRHDQLISDSPDDMSTNDGENDRANRRDDESQNKTHSEQSNRAQNDHERFSQTLRQRSTDTSTSRRRARGADVRVRPSSPKPNPSARGLSPPSVRTESVSSRTSARRETGNDSFQFPSLSLRRGATEFVPSDSPTDDDSEDLESFQGNYSSQSTLPVTRKSEISHPSLVDSDPTFDPSTETGAAIRVKGAVDWFWICQADVIPGYFATPWQSHFSESACVGAIAVALEALQQFTDTLTLQYVDRHRLCEEWVYQGKTTHPSYAINAMGGIIVAGEYIRVKFSSLSTRIPPISLLRSYEHQVTRPISGDGTMTRAVVERLAELMALDSWLSFCGRLPEICNGRNNLLRSTPVLVQKIMTDFDYEFRNLDRTATEGGWQIIKGIADLVLVALDKEALTAGEQLFTLMAVLRAAKMALCVVQGPSTGKLREILLQDVQVYLV